MILQYRFNSAVLRSLLYVIDFILFFFISLFFPITVCCGNVHLRQMPNPAPCGRSDKHRKEQHLLHKQNTHLAAAQMKKGCKCSAHTWYAFSDECTDTSPCLSFSSLQFMTFYKPMGNMVCFNNFSNYSPLFCPSSQKNPLKS